MKPGLAVLPLEVWADVFLSPWFTRQELAQILDGMVNRNFANKLDKLLHGCGQQTLHFLHICVKPSFEPNKCKYQLRKRKTRQCRKTFLTVALHGGSEQEYKDCDFPETDMPENIKTFKEVSIGHLDDQVLDFLDKIKPLFANVFLNIGHVKRTRNLCILFGHLIPMLGGIHGIYCTHECIEFLEQQFPGTLTRVKELELRLHNINLEHLSAYMNWLNIPTYLKWLNTPHQQGPRFLRTLAAQPEITSAIGKAVCKQFQTATTPATFVVFLERGDLHQKVKEFTIGNAITNEQLSVRNARFARPGLPAEKHIHFVAILRHPTGDHVEMREWLKKHAYYVENGVTNEQIGRPDSGMDASKA